MNLSDVMQRLATLEERVAELEADRDALARLRDKRVNDKPFPRREQEILHLFLTEGLSNKQMAHRMGIAQKTLENHLTRLYQRVDVRNRAQLFVWAQNHRDVWDESAKDCD